ncbi:hypothetical protein INT47_009803 [Mucor saturninus]|uniref:Uncharacterized protein n=1 Tax=Mucor saturninus TaxID=64648 RepID=A0A8H7V024_9FUNG|nr:hypothetical protein INT47_009803 [Mucor saturninus]
MGSSFSKTKSWRKINTAKSAKYDRVNYCTSAAKAVLEDDAIFNSIKAERKVRADNTYKETRSGYRIIKASISRRSSVSEDSIESSSSSYIVGHIAGVPIRIQKLMFQLTPYHL